MYSSTAVVMKHLTCYEAFCYGRDCIALVELPHGGIKWSELIWHFKYWVMTPHEGCQQAGENRWSWKLFWLFSVPTWLLKGHCNLDRGYLTWILLHWFSVPNLFPMFRLCKRVVCTEPSPLNGLEFQNPSCSSIYFVDSIWAVFKWWSL